MKEMAYISLYFYIFLALLLLIYYLLPLKYRWYSLLLGSISFYWHITGPIKQGFLMFIGGSFFAGLYAF